jgi:hypothetical protein
MSNESRSVFRTIRVRKEDSAFVYFMLESNEGIASYSTLPFAPGDPHRDLELRIPPDFVLEVDRLLTLMRTNPGRWPGGEIDVVEITGSR